MKLFNKTVSYTLPYVPKPIIGYFAKPYIAGESLDDAVDTVKALMDEGACATVDVLGEEITGKDQATNAVEIYKQVLDRIDSENLDSNISIKPTHLGLKLDQKFCYDNIRSLVTYAANYNNFVRIDMEDHTTTNETLDMFLHLREEFENVGTVLQAYLRRTVSDINKLIPMNPNLRICKGIYIEPYRIAYKDRDVVIGNFSYILEKLFQNDCYVGIATHDEKVVWEALRLIDRLNVQSNRYEFQMLLGVTPTLRKVILKAGHKLRVYVPFGAEWKHYSTRRLKENPDIIGHVISGMFSRQPT